MYYSIYLLAGGAANLIDRLVDPIRDTLWLSSSSALVDTISSSSISLTPRETECLTLVATGQSATQTATLLGVTRRTVEFHLQSARRKLGTKTSAGAVARALSLNLIEIMVHPAGKFR